MTVDGGDALRPRDRLVLSALIVKRGRVAAPGEIADAVWGEAPPPSWPKQVQICIVSLRKILGRGAIDTVSGGYRLVADGLDLDVDGFEQSIGRGQALLARHEPGRAAAALMRGLALWRGAPFDDLRDWAPARSEADRLEELYRLAQEDLLDARLAIGEHREAAAQAEILATQEPWRERRWAILALAQYRSGRQADALHSLQRARCALVDQLGIDPGPELADLETAILGQDVALRPPPQRPAVSPDCPYPGLAHYDVDDGDRFFGRDAEVAACLDRLRSSPLVVLAGPSGCGKSSLLRAGVVPAVRRQGRSVVVIVADSHAHTALVDLTVAAGATAAVLVVDQFEGLFAAGGSAAMVRDFCARLAAYARDRAPVVIAVRADHLASLAVEASLSRLVEQGLQLVSSLSGVALREAIVRPAAEAGLQVEEGLVDLVERDTEGEPGALPLMSHALAETWQRRDGDALTVEGYRAAGGIRAAVARSADGLYESLPSEQRTVLRSVLLRLVAPSAEGNPTQRRVPLRVLCDDPQRERVVSLLVGARLVTAQQDTAELAHEALARAWPRLRSWLEEDSAGQQIMRHLTAAADGWASLGRPPAELYRGARLETALEWRQAKSPNLTADEDHFLQESSAHVAAERAARDVRARQESRQSRRLRAMLTVTAMFLIGALIAGFAAVRSGREAGAQRDTARAAQETAQIEGLANHSLALRSTDRAVAALLAVEGYRRWPDDVRTRSALLGTFTADPGFMGYLHIPSARYLAGALIPGTATAVVALDGRELALVDRETGVVDHPFPPTGENAGDLSLLRVSGDGRRIAHLVSTPHEGCGDLDRLRITDNEGCAALSVFEVGGRRVLGPLSSPVGAGDLAINADGTLVAVAGGWDGDVVVYRTADGELLGTIAGLPRPAEAQSAVDTAAVTFDAADRLYVGSMAGPIRVVDPVTMQTVARYDAPPLSTHNHLAITAAGLIIGAGDRDLVAVDSSSGLLRWAVDVRDGRDPRPCPWFAVAERAGWVFCGNQFGVIEEHYLTTGRPGGATLDPQLNSVGDLAISADGRDLVAFGASAPVISSWRLDGSGPITHRVADGHVVYDGYDPDGEVILVAVRGSDATTSDDFEDFAVWDPVTDEVVDPFEPTAQGVGWSGDYLLGYFPTSPPEIGFYDVGTGQRTSGVEIPVQDSCCSFQSPGRRWMYLAFEDGELWTVDTRTRQRVAPTVQAGGRIRSVTSTGDGSRVVVTVYGDTETLTSVYDGSSGARVSGPLAGPGIMSMSSDGTLVGADGGEITQYDPETLEPIGRFAGARGEVNSLQFSAAGDVLLATANDQTVAVYDVATRTRLGEPIPTAAPFIVAGWLRPDGSALAVTDRTGVAVWDLDPRHQAEAACRLAGRNLTETEWTTYLAAQGPYRATCPEFPPAA